jgi:hypothetical protein
MRIQLASLASALSILLLALSAARAAPLNSPLIVGYDFSHSLTAGDMQFNGFPVPAFDGAGSNLAANPPNFYHAPEAQDLSPNNRDLWHEFRATGHFNTNSNLQPRYAYSLTGGSTNGTGLTGVVTYGIAMRTAAVNGNPTGTFANSELTSNGGFTLDATIEIDRTFVGAASQPLVTINNFTIGILGTNSGADAGKLAATVTGTFGIVGSGSPVKSASSVLKSTAANAPRPKYDVRVIWETNNAGTADDRLLLFLNGSIQEWRLATLNLASNNQQMRFLGSGSGGTSMPGVLVNNLYMYQGVPPQVQGVPEPASACVIGAAVMMLMLRRVRV